MSTQVDTAMRYIENDRVEAKIAGVMMLNQIFSSTFVGTSKVINKVFQSISVSLLVQMVQTETDEKSTIVQLAGLNFLVFSCESSSTMKSVMKYMKELSEVFIQTQRSEVKSQLVTFLKLLSSVVDRTDRSKIVAALLEAAGTVKNIHTLPILQLILDIASTPDVTPVDQEGPPLRGPESSICLSAAHNTTLRNLIAQGVHGAAPQATRDGTLLYIRDILTTVPVIGDHNRSIRYPLFPYWTWNKTQAVDDVLHSAAYPGFLCGIVRGELQLLCDELLFLATHSAESVAERFNVKISAKATVPLNTPSTGAATTSTTTSATVGTAGATDTAGGDANTTSSTTPATTTDTTTPVDTTTTTGTTDTTDPTTPQYKIDSDIHYFQSRVTRTHSMYLVCLQLLNHILTLLIDESTTCKGVSVWGDLPGEALLQIKKVIYSTLNDLFEFLLDCAEHLKECNHSSGDTNGSTNGDTSGNTSGTNATSGEMNAFTGLWSLRSLACCTLDTMTPFLEQDPELMGVFVKCLPKLVSISHFAGGSSVGGGNSVGSGSGSNGGSIDEQSVMQALCKCGDKVVDAKQLWLDKLAYHPNTTTNNTTNTTNTNTTPTPVVVHSELYLHLIEPVRTLVYMCDTGDLDPAVCDQLVDVYPQLLPPLLGLLHYTCTMIDSSGSSNSSNTVFNLSTITSTNIDTSTVRTKRDHLIRTTAVLLWLLRDLLSVQDGQHARDLTLLLRGDGPSAIKYAYGVEAVVLTDFAQLLRTVSARWQDEVVGTVEKSVDVDSDDEDFLDSTNSSTNNSSANNSSSSKLINEEQAAIQYEYGELAEVCVEVADLVKALFEV